MMKKRIVSLALAVPWRVAYSWRGGAAKTENKETEAAADTTAGKGRGDRGGSRRKNTFKMGYVG